MRQEARYVTSGIRVGSPALTSRGMKEKEFEIIANKIADVLDDINNTELQAKSKRRVKRVSSKLCYLQPINLLIKIKKGIFK